MEVKVNNKPVCIAAGATVSDLVKQLALPVVGVAIAVNNKMIPRLEWDAFILNENDTLVVIKAACGG